MIVVRNPRDSENAIAFLQGCTTVYFDFETTGLDPHRDTLIILSLHGTHPQYDSQTFVFDLLSDPNLVDDVAGVLEDPSIIKIAHNAVFDWKFLYNKGIYTSPVVCTMIQEQILKSGLLFSGFGLDDLAERRLGIKMDKTIRNGFINRDLTVPLTDAEIKYAADDAWVLEAIFGQQCQEIKQQGLVEVARLESSLIPTTSKMEYHGVCINDEHLRAAVPAVQHILDESSQRLQDEIIQNGLASELIFDADGYTAANVGSPKQMLDIFKRMGINVRSLGKKELSDWDAQWTAKNPTRQIAHGGVDVDGDDGVHIGYNHPVLRQHAIRTAAAKLQGTYILGLLDRINPVTGRIHPGFKQCGAVSTGRFSSVAPNFQNIPNTNKLIDLGLGEYDIRSMFIPAPGRKFIISDYSGIELSILAAMSNDQELIHQIIEGDIHSFVATRLIGDKIIAALGEPISKTNKKVPGSPHKAVRDLFKKVSYGIIYGSTGYNLYRTLYFDLLAVGITITQEECDVWVTRWKNELFPGTGEVLTRNSTLAVTRYYTESALGRKRYWPEDIRYDKWKMFAAMREGANQPIQATCADMVKRSMAWFDERVDVEFARLVACIHDELLVEVDDDRVDENVVLVKDVMESAARSLYPDADPRLFIAEPKVSDRYDK